MTHPEGWIWTRWQLMHVEVERDSVSLDAVELPVSEAEPAALLTLVFESAPDEPGSEVLRTTLQRWAEGATVCDVFRRSAADGCMAMFHGAESLLVTTGPPPA
jgi:hypothetical protein